ncbi:hypothetical protein ABZT02_30785 [Streptomyces sp. NPDC005402]|uniref:hypothetical protein n=1 Tax=Streptomyces sp. NPDC005402 TaxID=3155338 RepID=UPI0033AD0306
MVSSDPRAGGIFAAFIAEQLSEERSRKSSLETRGLALITSTSTLVTLLLAVATLATKFGKSSLPIASTVLMIVGLATFVMAGVAGVYCNSPQRYSEADPDDLMALLRRDYWTSDTVEAEINVTAAQRQILADARKENARKALFLLFGFASEIISIVTLGVAVAIILAS